MNQVLVKLIENGITDPVRLRVIATMMMAAGTSSSYLDQAGSIVAMNDQQLELATQQVVGGR